MSHISDPNYETILRSRRSRRRRRHALQNLVQIFVFLFIVFLIGIGGFFIFKLVKNHGSTWVKPADTLSSPSEPSLPENPEDGTLLPEADQTLPAENFLENDELSAILAQAERLAAGYDYDGAIALLTETPECADSQEVLDAIARYEAIKATLVEADVSQVTHVFFHSLIMDTSKAFDGYSDSKGYNSVMTTKDEFLKILNEMYNRGFVLVRLHDMAYETTDENGQTVMKKGSILLPEGKQPFVMSQDDVCYYEYMEGDGFATRIIVGEDGKPTCEMKMEDGTVSVGSYDLVPILEDFIQEHPDFSYKGARAVIAFTGYNGILGYRTDDDYRDKNPNFEADKQTASEVAQCLRDNGWELASHSWGHRDLGSIDYEDFKLDSDKWESRVESLIGPTDIILFPFGSDVSDWHPYTQDNKRFQYLHSLGFRYFCNVDSNQYWVQFGTDHLRQGRRNLDGYRMWKDIEAGSDTGKRKLDDLFRAEDVFDSARPTPVEWN